MIPLLFIILFLFETLFYFIGNHTYKIINSFITCSKITFMLIFYILNNSFIIYMLTDKYIPINFHKPIAYFSFYCFAAFIYLSIYYIFAFILNLIFKKTHLNFNIISLILVPITLIAGTYLSHSSYIQRYDIKIAKNLNTTIKIVLVSDIHLGDIVDKPRLNKMINNINSLNPDIVLIAGDLIDSDLNIVINKNMLSSLKNLKSTYGTYFSLGNHDYYTQKYSKLTSILKKYKVKTLRNKSILINNSFYIIGRDDESMNKKNSLRSITKNIDNKKPSIVMDHTPGRINESISNNIDLQVSGHTHNSQFFPGNIITNLIYKDGNGYKKFKNTNVVVSSGYGTWGPPIRTTSRSQIILITLHN